MLEKATPDAPLPYNCDFETTSCTTVYYISDCYVYGLTIKAQTLHNIRTPDSISSSAARPAPPACTVHTVNQEKRVSCPEKERKAKQGWKRSQEDKVPPLHERFLLPMMVQGSE